MRRQANGKIARRGKHSDGRGVKNSCKIVQTVGIFVVVAAVYNKLSEIYYNFWLICEERGPSRLTAFLLFSTSNTIMMATIDYNLFAC